MTEKINFETKIADSVTNIVTSVVNSLMESFQTLLREELDSKIEKIQEEINQINTKYDRVSEKITGLVETQNHAKTKIDELTAAYDNIIKTLDKTIQSELSDKMNMHFKEFHEEMEKIIDMSAALTVELSNRLDTVLEKINSLSTIENKQQDMFNELDKKIKSQVEKTSTIFESRVDGLRKHIEDKIISEMSIIPDIQEKLNQLNKMLNEVINKLATLSVESKRVEKPAGSD